MNCVAVVVVVVGKIDGENLFLPLAACLLVVVLTVVDENFKSFKILLDMDVSATVGDDVATLFVRVLAIIVDLSVNGVGCDAGGVVDFNSFSRFNFALVKIHVDDVGVGILELNVVIVVVVVVVVFVA